MEGGRGREGGREGGRVRDGVTEGGTRRRRGGWGRGSLTD